MDMTSNDTTEPAGDGAASGGRPSPAVRTAVSSHLDRLRNADYSEETVAHREQILLMVDSWLRTHRDTDLLTGHRADFDAWLTWLRTTASPQTGKVRGPGTRRTYLSNVKAWAADATDTGWLSVNPVAGIRVARGQPSERRPVFPAAAIPLAVRCATEPVKTWLVLGLSLGLRLGECRRIEREDVSELEVPPTLYVHGKGGRDRVVPLSDPCLLVLAPWLRSTAHGLLFRDPAHGGSYDRRKASRMVGKHLRDLGLPVTMHSTRHYAATAALAAGHAPSAVQELLGHANLASTSIYSHAVPGAVQAIVDELGLDLGRIVGRPGLRIVRGEDNDEQHRSGS